MTEHTIPGEHEHSKDCKPYTEQAARQLDTVAG